MALDAHVHIFPTEAAGVLGEGGTHLAGYAGVVEEPERILLRGRVAAFVAVMPPPQRSSGAERHFSRP